MTVSPGTRVRMRRNHDRGPCPLRANYGAARRLRASEKPCLQGETGSGREGSRQSHDPRSAPGAPEEKATPGSPGAAPRLSSSLQSPSWEAEMASVLLTQKPPSLNLSGLCSLQEKWLQLKEGLLPLPDIKCPSVHFLYK